MKLSICASECALLMCVCDEAFLWELKCNTVSRNVAFKCVGTSYEIDITTQIINASFPKFPLKLSSRNCVWHIQNFWNFDNYFMQQCGIFQWLSYCWCSELSVPILPFTGWHVRSHTKSGWHRKFAHACSVLTDMIFKISLSI